MTVKTMTWADYVKSYGPWFVNSIKNQTSELNTKLKEVQHDNCD